MGLVSEAQKKGKGESRIKKEQVREKGPGHYHLVESGRKTREIPIARERKKENLTRGGEGEGVDSDDAGELFAAQGEGKFSFTSAQWEKERRGETVYLWGRG